MTAPDPRPEAVPPPRQTRWSDRIKQSDTEPERGNLVAWLTSFGWPAVIGMAIFAVGGSIAAYLLVKPGWRLRVWLKRRRR